MEKSIRAVHENMLRLGLGALAHANWTSAFHSWESDVWSELSVVQAAHAAEILIKARIAQEHPLLIFERLPKPTAENEQSLSFERLLTEGRTYQYADLPSRLWATTGMSLPCTDNFLDFGRLRNSIQHFATPPDIDLSVRTLDFVFSVVDPFINSCWNLFAIDYCEDTEPYVNFLESIINMKITFLVSPESLETLDESYFARTEDLHYRELMNRRLAAARSNVDEQ